MISYKGRVQPELNELLKKQVGKPRGVLLLTYMEWCNAREYKIPFVLREKNEKIAKGIKEMPDWKVKELEDYIKGCL